MLSTGLWQTVQSVVSSKPAWLKWLSSLNSSSQLAMELWQLKQFSAVTGIALAFASAAGVSWQTLQLVMYVG